MTTIRPTAFPPPVQPGATPAPDAAKLAAQRAFFAAAMGQPQPAASAQVVAAPELAAQVVRTAPAPSDGAQKIPRPGSLFDIRV